MQQEGRIKDLQRANRANTNAKNKYLTIFESLQSPVAVLNDQNRVDIVNHTWATLFGQSATPGTDTNDSSSNAPSVAWLPQEIDGVVFSDVAKRKNGDAFPAMVNIALLRKADSSPLSIVCVLCDMSAEKTALEAFRRNVRLQGASALAGAVGHVLKQPLMAITGYAELVLSTCPANDPNLPRIKKTSRKSPK